MVYAKGKSVFELIDPDGHIARQARRNNCPRAGNTAREP
jgi:hypothetical protein